MKAYFLTIANADDAGHQLVFADTSKAAKRQVSGYLYDNLENYIDLRVNRAPKYDGLETLSEAELAMAQWRNGCVWLDMECPDPDESTDQDFLTWYEDTFGGKR